MEFFFKGRKVCRNPGITVIYIMVDGVLFQIERCAGMQEMNCATLWHTSLVPLLLSHLLHDALSVFASGWSVL